VSDDQKFAAQGRAHARAKTLRSEVSTAKAELGAKQRDLKKISEGIARIVQGSSPGLWDSEDQKYLDCGALVASLRVEYKELISGIADLAEEVCAKAKELEHLELEIKQF